MLRGRSETIETKKCWHSSTRTQPVSIWNDFLRILLAKSPEDSLDIPVSLLAHSTPDESYLPNHDHFANCRNEDSQRDGIKGRANLSSVLGNTNEKWKLIHNVENPPNQLFEALRTGKTDLALFGMFAAVNEPSSVKILNEIGHMQVGCCVPSSNPSDIQPSDEDLADWFLRCLRSIVMALN
jgi:hypothetical protein